MTLNLYTRWFAWRCHYSYDVDHHIILQLIANWIDRCARSTAIQPARAMHKVHMYKFICELQMFVSFKAYSIVKLILIL
jgi:hypothetical protein